MTTEIEKPLPESLNCEIHGAYMSRVSDEPLLGRYLCATSCPTCSANEKAREEAEAADQKREKFDSLLMSLGVSKRNLRHSFDSLESVNDSQSGALDSLKQYASEFSNMRPNDTGKPVLPSRGIIIVGPVGTGKTLLASALTRDIVSRGGKAEIAKTIDIVRSIKDTWGKKPADGTYHSSELDVMNRYCGLDLLIIDEIGVQFGSDTEKMIIFDVIDQRYNNMLPTMIISNLNIDGVKDMLGDRTIDRLREDGGKLIVLEGKSNRK